MRISIETMKKLEVVIDWPSIFKIKFCVNFEIETKNLLCLLIFTVIVSKKRNRRLAYIIADETDTHIV
jgi:hypothetical protein